MAETVKKSRIVSDNEDDNLEEALMEEFNIRLKSCMSQDDLQQTTEDDDVIIESSSTSLIVKTNGIASRDFIRAEQEDYYEVPIVTTKQNGAANVQQQNGHCHETNVIVSQVDDDDNANEYVDMSLNDDEGAYEIVVDPIAHESLTDSTEVKSVKDRMLLSTEVEPCLLFTQTVTSPMLTPSEENIDFLKGFRRESSSNNLNDRSEPTTLLTTDLDEDGDVIYENADFLNTSHKSDDVIYENLIPGGQENIYENVERLKENNGNLNDCSNTNGEEVKMIDDVEDDNNSEFVQSDINIRNNELKSVNIIKQINKFDESTQVTESYVETTTVESNCLSSEKGLKKKKSKKSRREEKENISVSDTNNQEESFYNVNVKNLCRSFGDLTKIEDDNNKKLLNNYCNNGFDKKSTVRIRTKSLSDAMYVPCNKIIENVFTGVSVRMLREKFHTETMGDGKYIKFCCTNTKTSLNKKSSFNKFDALQKKNVLHVRSSDSSKAQEKFNGAQVENSNCKACDKAVFQMEQIKAEKAIWHRNCFRCTECNKQLNVDTYQSHEGNLYCKPHFKALFAPKVVEDEAPPKPRKPELIIRENQPVELPPDVVRASDKPDLGLEELQSLNVKERFQVFEHHQQQTIENSELIDRSSGVNVKRSPSILSKLARFQAKGMDIGVPDDSLNGIPIEESSSEGDDNDDDVGGDDVDGEDADLIRAKRVQKEKPFHFTGMNDVKSKWEQGEQISSRDERREERKQEIQSIRNRLFLGKQGKMKEAYQQAVMESESCTNLAMRNKEPIEVCDTKSLKERFEKGAPINDGGVHQQKETEDSEVFESEISKKSRSLFLELDANASKAPQITPVPTPKLDVKKAREAYLTKATSNSDVVKSSIDQVDEIQVRTADIQERFKFFETYKEPEKTKKSFRITPPRDGQVKAATPEREVYRDPDVVRSEEFVEDSVVAKESHTATKMLNKFRQMEENLSKEPQQIGPKPLKRFTPPPEPARPESSSEAESGSEEDDDEGDDDDDEEEERKVPDEDLLEAQKAARAKQLRAKFERWEANEIKKEQSTVNIAEELGDEQSQIESTKSLRARFESMRDNSSDTNRTQKVKVNRFVELPNVTETCESCHCRVYPLEKISVHNHVYHKKCFKCMECNCVLRMDSYSYNQGLLYCMPHFKRIFISKGNYDTAFGLGPHKEKWNATVA